MAIILKFMLKNIKEKKLRTFLVVFSIMASAALYFASSGISTSIKATYIDIVKQFAGSSDIIISANSKSPTPYVNLDKAEITRDKTDYIIGEIDASAVYKNSDKDVRVSLSGFDYSDMQTMGFVDLNQSEGVKPFSGNKIIVSKKTADKYGFTVGQKLPLMVGKNGDKQNFIIVGIANNKGLFSSDSDRAMTAVVPQVIAGNINGVNNQYSEIYVKVHNSNNIDTVINKLTTAYKHYSVTKIVDEKVIDQALGQITMVFRVMMIVVLMMSTFIIYTVFKVIVAERLPVIGTFRSIGATRMSTSLVLIGESIIYGIIGGVVGNFAGIGILKLLMAVLAAQASGGMSITASVNYTPKQLISAFVFAIIVSVLSSIIPIVKTSKLSVKDVVLNTVDTMEKEKLWVLILGIIFILSDFAMPIVTKNCALGKTPSLILLGICMILSVVGVVMVVPFMTEIFVTIFDKIYNVIFGNEGSLAAKNLRKNKSLINNIALLTIGISTLFMLNIISGSVGKAVVNAYNIFNHDLYISNNDGNSLDRQTINIVRNTAGVQEIQEGYEARNIEVSGSTDKISDIMFMDEYYIKNFWKIKLLQDEKSVFNAYKDGRTILMTTSNLKRFGKNVGDYITIKTNRGSKDYKIVGSYDSMMYNGNSVIIPNKYARGDFNLYQCSTLNIKTSKSPDSMAKLFAEKFKTRQIGVETIAKMEKQNEQQNNAMLSLIKAFPIIALIIGAFGVINNFFISFIERKRHLAVYASVGMNRHQTRKMLFIEALSIGLIGSIGGIVGGSLMIHVIPAMLDISNFPMDIYYSSSAFITSIILGVLITVISSIVPSLKSSKLNIIEAIKYE
ncbi:ABC transporter permease [Clostridium acetobutylicum]|nr:ABC transporter permease [Clostridium acetobutylicum]